MSFPAVPPYNNNSSFGTSPFVGPSIREQPQQNKTETWKTVAGVFVVGLIAYLLLSGDDNPAQTAGYAAGSVAGAANNAANAAANGASSGYNNQTSGSTSTSTSTPAVNWNNVTVTEDQWQTAPQLTCNSGTLSVKNAKYHSRIAGNTCGADVTAKLQQLVSGKSTYKYHDALNGLFGDPCPGVPKHLQYEYACQAGV